jgi:hypothetical protein
MPRDNETAVVDLEGKNVQCHGTIKQPLLTTREKNEQCRVTMKQPLFTTKGKMRKAAGQ